MFTHDQTALRLIWLMEGRIWNTSWQLNSSPSTGSFGVGVLACDSDKGGIACCCAWGRPWKTGMRAVRGLFSTPLLRTVEAVLDYYSID